jgi:hypothetical protein
MIVKIIVLISQPVRMELILRKRIATTIGKTEGWWSGKAMKYLLGYVRFIFLRNNLKQFVFEFFRNHLNEPVLFMKLFQVYQNIFMKLKIEKVWH